MEKEKSPVRGRGEEMIVAILVIVVLNTIFNSLFMVAFLWGVFSDSKNKSNEGKLLESEKLQSSQRKE